MMTEVGERVAVTGVGILSALGSDAARTFSALMAGRVAFRELQRFSTYGFRAATGAEVELEVVDVVPRQEAERWSRSDAMALVAARAALEMAGTRSADPCSLVVGASTAGMWEAENALDTLRVGDASAAAARALLSFPLSATADRLREVLPVDRAVTVCSACSSGANAALVGVSWLRRRQARRVLVGGTDALCRLTFAGFNALGATDPAGCRPFDAERQGLTLGEGAAFLVLEPESVAVQRGARILAWLTGWAGGAEAFHITQPEPSGATARRLIRDALARAGLAPADIDYVNAHGTGTQHNDAMEARAVATALGDHAERVWISSSKGQLGHTLAAAGALEAAVTVLAVAGQQVPPSGGLSVVDPSLPLLRHVTGTGRGARVRAALSSSFGFGGTGVVLAFESADASPRPTPAPARSVVITGAACWGPDGGRFGVEAAELLQSGTAPERASSGPALDRLDPERSRRFDEAAAVTALCAEQLLDATRLDPERVGIFSGTAFGAVERSIRFVERVVQRGARAASPAEFPHLVPSAAVGNASIYTGATGPVLAVSDLTSSAETAIRVAESFIALELADAAVAGGVAPDDPLVATVLGPICADRGPRAGHGAGWVLLETPASAARRGVSVLAVVAQIGLGSDASKLLGALPEPGPRAGLVLTDLQPHTVSALQGSPWASVTQYPIAPWAGWHDALGGVALAAAAAAVGCRELDQALVWTRRDAQWFLALLCRPQETHLSSGPVADGASRDLGAATPDLAGSRPGM